MINLYKAKRAGAQTILNYQKKLEMGRRKEGYLTKKATLEQQKVKIGIYAVLYNFLMEKKKTFDMDKTMEIKKIFPGHMLSKQTHKKTTTKTMVSILSRSRSC